MSPRFPCITAKERHTIFHYYLMLAADARNNGNRYMREFAVHRALFFMGAWR